MELLFLKVCFLSCCWGLFWVEKLAEPRDGLLKFVHKYYPKKLENALNCAVCVSGWFSNIYFVRFIAFLRAYFTAFSTISPCGVFCYN